MSDSTPSGVRVIALRPDGTQQNVTEAVQVLYDLVIQSMDFGSGFLTVEDVLPMVRLATFCGFKGFEAAESYLRDQEEVERQRQALLQKRQAACRHEQWKEAVRSTRGRRTLICVECGLSKEWTCT